MSLTYDSGAPPRLYADPVYATTGFEVKPDDTKNTLDPLSAVTFIFSGVGAEAGNPCDVTAPVFDGRRRYDIEMTKVKDVDIKMDNGLYQGKAMQCDVHYNQIAGFRPRVLKDNEKFPSDPCLVRQPSQLGGRPRLCRAGPGLGGNQVWRAGDAGHCREGRWASPKGCQA